MASSFAGGSRTVQPGGNATAIDFTLDPVTGSLPAGLLFSGWDANPVPIPTSVSGIPHSEGSHNPISFGATNSNCVSELNPTSESFPASGGSGLVNVTAAQGCNWTASSTASFITVSGASGSGSGTFNFSVTPNNGPERSGSIVIDQRVFNITQSQGGSCAPMPIIVGQTLNDSLTTGSCPLGDGSSYEAYSFNGLAGQQISILMTASFDTRLFLLRPDGFILAQDDNGGGGTNSRIPSGSGLLTLPTGGTYTIRANSYFVMNVDGREQTNLTQRRPNISGEPALSILPRWSPDGTRLVFGAESTNGRRLFVMNPDGTGLAETFSMHAGQPGWSPDGNQFTFTLLGSIYVSNLDGAGLREVTSTGSNSKPDWQSVAPSVAHLSAAVYPVTEGTPNVSVMVTRTGGISGAATVDYATGDAAGTNNCSLSNGFASSRCDYLTTIGTLHFAANEMSKTITIPIVDDSYVEGSESFTFTLSNASGATFATPASATITIADNDATNGTNPIDRSSFFVRQHYIDFLNREPDAAGLAFWSDQISSCGTDAACVELRRINVSAAFFLSIEFQQTGYLVYRMYKAAYGNIPNAPEPVRLNEFLSDTQQIGKGVVVGRLAGSRCWRITSRPSQRTLRRARVLPQPTRRR